MLCNVTNPRTVGGGIGWLGIPNSRGPSSSPADKRVPAVPYVNGPNNNKTRALFAVDCQPNPLVCSWPVGQSASRPGPTPPPPPRVHSRPAHQIPPVWLLISYYSRPPTSTGRGNRNRPWPSPGYPTHLVCGVSTSGCWPTRHDSTPWTGSATEGRVRASYPRYMYVHIYDSPHIFQIIYWNPRSDAPRRTNIHPTPTPSPSTRFRVTKRDQILLICSRLRSVLIRCPPPPCLRLNF